MKKEIVDEKERIHKDYLVWKDLYWCSGVWRRFSFEEFIIKSHEIVLGINYKDWKNLKNKMKKHEQNSKG